MSSPRIEIPIAAITEFCQRRHVGRMELFGSALRDDFRPDSDVDLLVEFDPGVLPRFSELVAMEEELERMLGRKVDLVERDEVERSENYIRRRHILKTLEPVYVAG